MYDLKNRFVRMLYRDGYCVDCRYELDHDPELQARILVGEIEEHEFQRGIGGERVCHRVGKRRAGRLLDGREWNQYPEVPHGIQA